MPQPILHPRVSNPPTPSPIPSFLPSSFLVNPKFYARTFSPCSVNTKRIFQPQSPPHPQRQDIDLFGTSIWPFIPFQPLSESPLFSRPTHPFTPYMHVYSFQFFTPGLRCPKHGGFPGAGVRESARSGPIVWLQTTGTGKGPKPRFTCFGYSFIHVATSVPRS